MTVSLLKMAPNALTASRIALSAAVFILLAVASGAAPLPPPPSAAIRSGLIFWAFGIFTVSAVTDFLDGWLARRLDAVSLWGAVLDPIADKIAVAAAVPGLLLLTPNVWIAAPGFAILFREMFVSGLREGLAPLGVRLPVTVLAKSKTTLQLAALSLEMLADAAPAIPFGASLAHGLLWIAALVTLWTGWEYLQAGVRHIGARPTKAA